MDIINKTLTLKLNRNWCVVGVDPVRDAFKNFAKGTHDAIRITYALDDDGKEIYDFTQCNIDIVKYEDWENQTARQCDRFIGTGKHTRTNGNRVIIPTVLIAKQCKKNIIVQPPCSSDNIRLRDENRCQWSGKTITKSNATIDHIWPVSLGGETSWENCVLCDREVNNLKGNMKPEAFTKKYGYKLLKKPKKPAPKHMVDIIKNAYNIKDWDMFLK